MPDPVNDKSRHRRRGRKNKATITNKKSLQDVIEMKFRPHKSLLINLTEETPAWYACGRHTPGRDETIFSHPPTKQQDALVVERYRTLADQIIQVETELFSTSNRSKDEQWVENTMKRGTLKDRIAAMSVVVSTSPVHKLYALDGLLQLAGCSETNPGQANSRISQMAAEAVADLLQNTLLPSSRKLFTLEHRPLHRYDSSSDKKDNKTLSPRILLLWRFEEMIKHKYQLFIEHYLKTTLAEGMETSKLFALRASGTLLRSVPEGEGKLLGIIVNKLGDPSKKVAASAGHELRRLLAQHPNMQMVVAREVQQLSHRPQLSSRALYNCIVFLNQLKLHKTPEPGLGKGKDRSLPASLIDTYFGLFEVTVNGDQELKSRLLSAILTGVNRARPYLPDREKRMMDDNIDGLYRIVHAAPSAARTQALMLLFHVVVGTNLEDEPQETCRKPSVAEIARRDRFYRALYATLPQASILSCGKHLTMHFNLLYKAMKYDTDSTRVVALAKRLLSSVLHCSAPVAAATLFLLNEVEKCHPILKDCIETNPKGATTMLDPTKREPRAALIQADSQSSRSDDPPNGAPLWELALMSHHHHPSVSKFATTIGSIGYDGDPLYDFGLAPFLDRFAYRNPKARKSERRMESVAEKRIQATLVDSLPVNDPSFLEKTSFTEQEEFFRKFFVERARRDERKGLVRGRGAEAREEDEAAQEQAFHESEAMDIDRKFDADDETDSEEEAFVKSLAQKLMNNDNYDDEDPDMEGWSDLENAAEIDSSEDASGATNSDDDAFMDSSDDDEQELFVALADASDSDDENNGAGEKQPQLPSETFVDASEYEDLIEKSVRNRKRRAETAEVTENHESSLPLNERKKITNKKSNRKCGKL